MASLTLRIARAADERRFFLAMSILMLATVLVGFGRSFFLRAWFPDHPAPPESVFYWHGAVFAGWYLLLVVQSTLIAAGRVATHRVLGRAGAALAAVMVVLGSYAALVAAGREGGFIGIPVPPLAFLAIPFVDMLVFPILVGCAIAKRNVAQTHKRLMLIASTSMLGAAVARLPFDFIPPAGPIAFFGLTDVFLVAIVVWDFATRGRIHSATLWGSAFVVVSQVLRLMMSGTEPWLAFAGWAVRLVN
jgi:uncharacterized membrane protein YozB (DUF420 family)